MSFGASVACAESCSRAPAYKLAESASPIAVGGTIIAHLGLGEVLEHLDEQCTALLSKERLKCAES